MIRLRDISKVYEEDIAALCDVSLDVMEKDFVSIVGRSGSGKTTLIKLLIGEEKPTAGEIVINGWDLCNIKSRKIPYFRREIGVVFQDFKLLQQKTVAENIAFALIVLGTPRQEIHKRVPGVLSLVGLSGKGTRFPNELSGGEQQRVAIARAFVHEPKLLLADELTGDLDAIYAWEIMEILLKINKMGTTVLIATHDKSIVNRLQKRVVTLEDGTIIRDHKKGRYVI
ncbi:cell division ATP-binding protein FtsE [Patescibacteria group bacterium]|nr:cell division ATP-binding protein FtsE [Patescibacteria group bacterium]